MLKATSCCFFVPFFCLLIFVCLSSCITCHSLYSFLPGFLFIIHISFLSHTFLLFCIYIYVGVCVCMYLFTHVRMFVIVMSIGYNVEGRSSVFVVQSTITSFFLFYFIFFRSPIVLFFYCHVHSDQTRKPSRGLFMIPVINYTSGAGLQMSTQRNRQITVTGGESTSQQEFSSLSLHQICMMFIRRNQRRKSQERPIHINKLAEVNPFRRVCVPATILHLLAGQDKPHRKYRLVFLWKLMFRKMRAAIPRVHRPQCLPIGRSESETKQKLLAQ